MADLLVIGLGNPGEEYSRSRHNVGFEVIEELARRHGGRPKLSKKERAVTAEVRISGRRVVLAKPTTYVNDSGHAAALLVRRYDVDPSHVVIVHDELDLPVGRLKVKEGGGLAGHNGLRSLKQHLHTDEFVRVRLGVGKPPSKERGADHVLKRMPKAQRAELDVIVQEAADAVELIAVDGVAAAMTAVNAR